VADREGKGMAHLPDRDTAEPCDEHPSCIKGFKRRAEGELMPRAGWWHFAWDQKASQWNLTSPDGELSYVIVQMADAAYPPAALIGAAPGRLFEPIVRSIEQKGLFPP
jgi:hypothetical protein